MKIMSNLSEKEKNLLFLLVTLLIIVGTYQFGFVRFMNKAEQLQDENLALTIEKNELQIKKNKEEKYTKETSEFIEKTKQMLVQFPMRITQDKSIIFVKELENESNIKVSSISFQDITTFYTTNQSEGAVADRILNDEVNETSEEKENSEEKSDEVNTSKRPDATNKAEVKEKDDSSNKSDTEWDVSEINLGPSNLNITGYSTSFVITYQANYKALKKSINFINNYRELMNITDISAAFDNTTGNLTGSITIQVYALAGVDLFDKQVDIPDIELGTSNIFGSFELPTTEIAD